MQAHPTFAFVTIGSGGYLGSTVRDLILANSLHRRGYKVVVYWMLERSPHLVDDGIRQRLLCHGVRYHFRRPSEFLDRVIGPLLFLAPVSLRVRVVQSMSGYVDRLLENLIRALFATPEADRLLVKRLLNYTAQDGVTHLMMSFASICPLALEAKKSSSQPLDYVACFQGDEEFANYAVKAGLRDEYHRRLDQAVQGSSWPAIAVSQDYLDRMAEQMQLAPDRLRVVYNGIELSKRQGKPPFSVLQELFPNLRRDVPIVSYVGRQDSEKGIDLLLYAAKMLQVQGVALQLVICGATAKGQSYQKVIQDLAGHLGIVIHHAGLISPQVRHAVYAYSHCTVCPSINREAFGLVVAEAMSLGTPVLVSNYGGMTEVMQQGERAGGLTFNVWNSGDLAMQLQRLLTDESLHRRLAGDARAIAARFSVDRMTDNVLQHIEIATHQQPSERCRQAS